MRICWIHPTTKVAALEPVWNMLETEIPPLLSPGSSVAFRYTRHSADFTRSLYAEHLNSVAMMDEAIAAASDGFDGVYFGCWNDPLWEAREVLDIPVASVGEQSMLAALAMGRRFAVVTVSEKTATAIERDITLYGLRERAIIRPARSIAPESDAALLLGAVRDPGQSFIPRFEAAARQCIADGADVILVGCAWYGPLLRRAGYTRVSGTDVPVIDSTTVAIKYLEAMIGIARCTSAIKSGAAPFSTPDQEKIRRARAALGMPRNIAETWP
ncbi:aspartate/glutamate racemase family protein [Burkholderia sp. Ax-1719]|uniref:aspartate/glutamate racemase family protein n=1 Tax=Burkholderia sp. Ax-1719 TaxID=2608334 RepID=UPI00141DE793|nr:aspartate/glutamate racemase family protein [Burkholderia sp. Ax-1719]NIE63354.1 hydantoin racemase [Burkholderia sp. Ax-1719]